MSSEILTWTILIVLYVFQTSIFMLVLFIQRFDWYVLQYPNRANFCLISGTITCRYVFILDEALSIIIIVLLQVSFSYQIKLMDDLN